MHEHKRTTRAMGFPLADAGVRATGCTGVLQNLDLTVCPVEVQVCRCKCIAIVSTLPQHVGK